MQADDFFNAYLVLKDNSEALKERLQNNPGEPLIGNKEPGTRITGHVDIVCLAFSIELYLKELYSVVQVESPRKHDILVLFENLPKQIKKKIFSHDSISQNPFFTRGNIMLKKRFASDFSAYDGFLEKIELISGGFEKWRYSYENKSLHYDVSFALALIESIKSVTGEVRKIQP